MDQQMVDEFSALKTQTQTLLEKINATSVRASSLETFHDIYFHKYSGGTCVVAMSDTLLVGLPHMQENNADPIASLRKTLDVAHELDQAQEQRYILNSNLAISSLSLCALTSGLTHRFSDTPILSSIALGLTVGLAPLPWYAIKHSQLTERIQDLSSEHCLRVLLEHESVPAYLEKFCDVIQTSSSSRARPPIRCSRLT